MNLPILCGWCNDGTLAATYVDNATRQTVTCTPHLPGARTWAGRGGNGGTVTTRPVVQPDGVEQPDGYQDSLF